MKEALYFEKKENNVVRCLLCPHHCVLTPGKYGLCMVRQNVDGTLFSLNYNRSTEIDRVDPIEKKPLYHFYPGSVIISLGTLGCNLSCVFCQNYHMSQVPANYGVEAYLNIITRKTTPQEVAAMAKKKIRQGNIGVSYTYNEPSIWYEFVLESCKEVKKAGLANVLVTNGYLEPEPLKELLPFVDAMNVDLKSIEDAFYKKLCRGSVKPVLEYCKIAKEKALVEVTNLIVTGENDSLENIEGLVTWVAEKLGRDTPLHFSRYHPDFNFDAPPTPVETLTKAYEIGNKKLDYVYMGNVWGTSWNSTRCPSCHKVVIERSGFGVDDSHLKDGNHCKYCGAKVAIVGEVK